MIRVIRYVIASSGIFTLLLYISGNIDDIILAIAGSVASILSLIWSSFEPDIMKTKTILRYEKKILVMEKKELEKVNMHLFHENKNNENVISKQKEIIQFGINHQMEYLSKVTNEMFKDK